MDELDAENQKWAEQAGRQLRAHEEVLAQSSQARLRSVRGQALQAASETRRPWLFWPALSATAGCAALLAWTVLITAPIDMLPVMDELEMTAAQDVELLEDLEFVAWMLAEQEVDDAPSQG
jgi:hypothetical protein